MTEQDKVETPAHPLAGFQLLQNPDQQALAMIAFETVAGPSLFIVNKEMLEELSAEFKRLADTMPRENDV